jgi:hypothetical protein
MFELWEKGNVIYVESSYYSDKKMYPNIDIRWYYVLKCKYGEIYYYDLNNKVYGVDVFSAKISSKIYNKYKDIIIDCDAVIGDENKFLIKEVDIKKIAKELKPIKKRYQNMSENEKKKIAERLKKAREKRRN